MRSAGRVSLPEPFPAGEVRFRGPFVFFFHRIYPGTLHRFAEELPLLGIPSTFEPPGERLEEILPYPRDDLEEPHGSLLGLLAVEHLMVDVADDVGDTIRVCFQVCLGELPQAAIEVLRRVQSNSIKFISCELDGHREAETRTSCLYRGLSTISEMVVVHAEKPKSTGIYRNLRFSQKAPGDRGVFGLADHHPPTDEPPPSGGRSRLPAGEENAPVRTDNTSVGADDHKTFERICVRFVVQAPWQKPMMSVFDVELRSFVHGTPFHLG